MPSFLEISTNRKCRLGKRCIMVISFYWGSFCYSQHWYVVHLCHFSSKVHIQMHFLINLVHLFRFNAQKSKRSFKKTMNLRRTLLFNSNENVTYCLMRLKPNFSDLVPWRRKSKIRTKDFIYVYQMCKLSWPKFSSTLKIPKKIIFLKKIITKMFL